MKASACGAAVRKLLHRAPIPGRALDPACAASRVVRLAVRDYRLELTMIWGRLPVALKRNMQDNTNVLSLHRLEPVVNKFIKVAIPTDLERLDKHRMNMEKSRQLQDWKSVNREQINASRTVQQLKHNLRELESLRIRLRAIDQPTFDDRVRPTQDRAATVVQDFLGLYKAMQQAPGCPKLETSEETMLKSDKANVVFDDATDAAPCGAGAYITECADQEAQQVQLQVQQQQIEESWAHLAKDLHELDNLVTEFSQLVYVQQETMDSITENVERASDNVAEGTKQLGKAVQGAATVLPVAGAVLGGAIAGPLGLLAGLKIGGLIAALGGGLLGFTGGRVIQKHRQKQANQELQKLSSSNAS